MTLACPARYADESTGASIPCQWRHDPEGLHHAHWAARCIMWVDGDAAAINSASACASPPRVEFAEYGYLIEYPDGARCFGSFLDHDRERALGQFNTLESGPEGERLLFVSRRVTQTPWTEES